MNRPLRHSLATLLATAGLWSASAAFAAGPSAPGSDARLMNERATCDGVQQDRAACLREAGAARQEARRNGLTSPDTPEQNAIDRCRAQLPKDRADCIARVRGTGMTTTEGSVMGGGVIRETVTPIPAPGAMPPAAPAPAASINTPTPMSAPAPMTAPAPVTAPMPVTVPSR